MHVLTAAYLDSSLQRVVHDNERSDLALDLLAPSDGAPVDYVVAALTHRDARCAPT